MTGHLLVPALDADAPATLSRRRAPPAARGARLRRPRRHRRARHASGQRQRSASARRRCARWRPARTRSASDTTRPATRASPRFTRDRSAQSRSGRLAAARVEEAAARVDAVMPVGLAERDRTGARRGGRGGAARAPVRRRRPRPLPARRRARRGAVHRRRPRRLQLRRRRAPRLARRGVRRAASPDNRRLVLVLRDACRRPEQRAAARELLARHPRAVVVETGLPGWRPEGAAGYVATLGAGRVNLDAAAELLARG